MLSWLLLRKECIHNGWPFMWYCLLGLTLDVTCRHNSSLYVHVTSSVSRQSYHQNSNIIVSYYMSGRMSSTGHAVWSLSVANEVRYPVKCLYSHYWGVNLFNDNLFRIFSLYRTWVHVGLSLNVPHPKIFSWGRSRLKFRRIGEKTKWRKAQN